MSPSRRMRNSAIRIWITTILLAMGLTACGGGDSPAPTPAPQQAASFAVAKAACGTGDHQETGLQGQVPVSAQVGGFKGFNCNVQPTSATPSVRGEGLFGMFALMHDKSGHVCGYTGGAFEDSFGTSVVDLTDPSHGVETAVLTTPGITNPGEGLKVHEGRGLLVAAYYMNPPLDKDVNHGFDVYDVATDCRHPQLLASTTALSFSMAGLTVLPSLTYQATERIYGHEGWFSRDGLTYYVSDLPHGAIHAVDIADPAHPKILDTYQHPFYGQAGYSASSLYWGTVHGGSTSTDGNRGYFAAVEADFATPGSMAPQTGPWVNGFATVDTSEIQSRKPGGKMKFMNNVVVRDGGGAQLTIPVTIKGNKYVFHIGEIGGALLNPVGFTNACAAGVMPFSAPELYYIGDETNPQLINKLRLEVNDPKNCAQVQPDVAANGAGGVGFLNDVHHCSVDNRDNATTLACGFFLNGIRVFDIRDPQNIKEIAYYVPPAKTAALHWCAAMPILDAKTGSVYSWCADTGVVALKFRAGVWPFPETTTPTDKQL